MGSSRDVLHGEGKVSKSLRRSFNAQITFQSDHVVNNVDRPVCTVCADSELLNESCNKNGLRCLEIAALLSQNSYHISKYLSSHVEKWLFRIKISIQTSFNPVC